MCGSSGCKSSRDNHTAVAGREDYCESEKGGRGRRYACCDNDFLQQLTYNGHEKDFLLLGSKGVTHEKFFASFALGDLYFSTNAAFDPAMY